MNQTKRKKDSWIGENHTPVTSLHSGPVARVLAGNSLDPPPVWLMRQAGRYLPEYRAIRAKVGSFLDLCFDPDLASEITLQPVRRFDFDAAILFSDILVVPHILGRKVEFIEGAGPKLQPIGEHDIDRLELETPIERLAPVLETVAQARRRLPPEKSLIGFCGAPWTVATYMVAGHATSDQLPARVFAAAKPQSFARLIEHLADVSADYLIGQLRAGADAVQIFDSWAGALDETGFERWSIAPTAHIVSRIREVVRGAKIIGFPKGAGLYLERYARETGIDGLSLDWTVPLGYARDVVQPHVAVQGNLEPAILYAGGAQLDRAVDNILGHLAGGPFIFNLGHGILPETPLSHVEHLVKRVRDRR
jgi:uroporphyrinogen decarboxylase